MISECVRPFSAKFRSVIGEEKINDLQFCSIRTLHRSIARSSSRTDWQEESQRVSEEITEDLCDNQSYLPIFTFLERNANTIDNPKLTEVEESY